jgi:hypothetical protein
VPNIKPVQKLPCFLSKQEMTLLFQYLEKEFALAKKSKNKHALYNAYLVRALVWMLYTA